MDNPFPYTDSNKRYHTQSYYLKKRFGCKVMKISLNGDMTCPNIDGTKGTGGCAFCKAGSSRFGGDPAKSIREQFEGIRAVEEKKWGRGMYIAYFQANSNTYCTVEKLRRLTDEALNLPRVAGISISTRPDCIPTDMEEFLAQLSQRTYLVVELGLQTIHDETAAKLNRCHTCADFTDAVQRLSAHGINICAHIINGLPGETSDMMTDTARFIAALPLHSVKIHLLHILRGIRLAAEYERGAFTAMTREDYVRTVVSQLEVLPPEFVIERLTGDGAWSEVIAPLWSLKKMQVLNEIDKLMAREDTWQGKKHNERKQ